MNGNINLTNAGEKINDTIKIKKQKKKKKKRKNLEWFLKGLTEFIMNEISEKKKNFLECY